MTQFRTVSAASFAAALVLGGCSAAGSQVEVAEPSVTSTGAEATSGDQAATATTTAAAEDPAPSVLAARYADALDAAFDAFEVEIDLALSLEYGSLAEAEAVAMTLTPRRLHLFLHAALAQRGLSVDGLAEFAEAHPEFFHEQQQRYWGRLATFQSALQSLATHVEPTGPTTVSMLQLGAASAD